MNGPSQAKDVVYVLSMNMETCHLYKVIISHTKLLLELSQEQTCVFSPHSWYEHKQNQETKKVEPINNNLLQKYFYAKDRTLQGSTNRTSKHTYVEHPVSGLDATFWWCVYLGQIFWQYRLPNTNIFLIPLRFFFLVFFINLTTHLYWG